MTIPVLSKYAEGLESRVKARYLEKIKQIGIDPASIPSDQFSNQCLPPIEQSDLFSYLVLTTSHYTNDQFKNYKSLEAYNQVVSGFIASVKGKKVSGKYVVTAKVRHSQRMNDPLVDIWIIAEDNGSICSAHCLGCKAGLAESCSHVASALFYIECWTRINGKLACTQVKCTWILPSFDSDVSYERVKDIDFTSSAKLKQNLDEKIDSINENSGIEESLLKSESTTPTPQITSVSAQELASVYKKLNNCNIKPALLSLVDPYADQFISQSREIPVIQDLYDPANLQLEYPVLLRKCLDVKIDITEEQISTVERDTRTQSKGPGFFRHRAGRIGASVCGAAFHTNLCQPSQSLIESICYPNLYKLNSRAIKHGCKHEQNAINAYKQLMQSKHVNLKVENCGLFINKDYPYLHATPDFLVSCDCCGTGCGEVKCPFIKEDCDFDKYLLKKNSCLEKVNGKLQLKKHHNYYFQVQQQLFTLSDRKYADFVVFAIDSFGNTHIVCDRIYPDPQHAKTVVYKLEIFWRICILPEILARWYTRKCNLPVKAPDEEGICFCRGKSSGELLSCSNNECPYGTFHKECLMLDNTAIPKTWYCPHCSRLPQFKRTRGKRNSKQSTIDLTTISKPVCHCNTKPAPTDRLVECHGTNCESGHYFHLSCLGLKRMPHNSKTTWMCMACRKKQTKPSKTKSSNLPDLSQAPTGPPKNCTPGTTTSTSSELIDVLTELNQNDSDNSSDSDIEITKVTTGSVNKFGVLAQLTSSDYATIKNPIGWLTCDMIQAAHVLLQEVNPCIEGLQRPTLGRCRNFNVVTGDFIQILHTGNDHWVCISSILCQTPGHVYLYDSLFHEVINQEVEEQTIDLLGGNLVSLTSAPVQQQNNGSDCGVFSIAFATCLAFSMDPSHVTFDVPKMRPHLISCLRDGKISTFPAF